MKKIIVCLFLLTSFVLQAQGDKKAIKLLDNVAENMEKSKGISAKFSLSLFASNGKQEGSTSGDIKMNGSSFFLSSPEISTWYDGKQMWSWLKSSNEVNLTQPGEEDLQSVNPYFVMKSYRSQYTCKYVKNNGSQDIVSLTPKKQGDIAHILLWINPSQMLPTKIELKLKNGSKQLITVTSLRNGLNYPSSTFVFNPKEYPKVEVIDLR